MSELVVVLSDAQLDALAEKLAAKLGNVTPAAEPPDVWLMAGDAAKRIGRKPAWVYAHANSLPFIVRLGRGVRVSERRLTKWMEKQGAAR